MGLRDFADGTTKPLPRKGWSEGSAQGHTPVWSQFYPGQTQEVTRSTFLFFNLLLLLLLLVGLDLNSGLHAQASTLQLEPYLLHFVVVILEIGSHELFPQAGLLMSVSQVARITGVSHHHLSFLPGLFLRFHSSGVCQVH
jgi:hypothetical protein